MSTFLITGASRGIGLSLVRRLAFLPSTSYIFAITRTSSPALTPLISARPQIIHNIIVKDLTSPDGVVEMVRQVEKILEGRPLDFVVNNAGVMPLGGTIEELAGEALMEVLRVNVVGALGVTNAVLGPMRRDGGRRVVVQISSELGSITNTHKFHAMPAHAYKISKAALNMLNMQYALDLGGEGFTFLAVSPGWLKTDMGSENADLEVDVGVRAVVETILEAGPEVNGKMMQIRVEGWEHAEGANRYDGRELPF